MDKKNTIVEELKDICPAVANISRKNVYTVPLGYFEKFAEKLLSLIEQKEQVVLPKSSLPFSIPQDYFQSLAGLVLQKLKQENFKSEIEEELDAISPLLNTISKTPVYSIPAGYFEGFSTGENLNNITSSISGEKGKSEIEEEVNLIAPLLNTIKKTPVFSVPTGYFENLGKTVVEGLASAQNEYKSEVEAELNTIAPLLNTIKRTNVYSIPQGYFESFQSEAPVEKKPGKVRSLFTNTKAITRYAVAAVTAGILLTGSVLFMDKNDVLQNTQNNRTATAYKAEQLKSLSDEEILEYLNSYASPAEISLTNTIDPEQDDLKSILKDMSEEEIKEYLKENAEPNELHSKEG